MVQPVREHDGVAVAQRADDGEIGEVAGGERKRARSLARRDELGELGLHGLVRDRVPRDEMRRAGSHAPARERTAGSVGDAGVRGEPEVVVARERNDLAPVDGERASLGGFDDAARAREACGAAPVELDREPGDERRRHASGTSPSRSNSARSASTSGLAVVSRRSP